MRELLVNATVNAVLPAAATPPTNDPVELLFTQDWGTPPAGPPSQAAIQLQRLLRPGATADAATTDATTAEGPMAEESQANEDLSMTPRS